MKRILLGVLCVGVTAMCLSACGASDVPQSVADAWPIKWCQTLPDVSKEQLVTIMGQPTTALDTQLSWSAPQYKYRFTAFFNADGTVKQLEIMDYMLNDAEKAALPCDAVRVRKRSVEERLAAVRAFLPAISGAEPDAQAPSSTTNPVTDNAPSTGRSDALVPFIVGLTTVRAVSDPKGDYESLRVITSIDAARYRIEVSGEVPGDDSTALVKVNVQRKVLTTDQAAARRLRTYFHTDDEDSYPGTVPIFSAAMVNDLRNTGKTGLTFLDVGTVFGVLTIKRELSGTLTRVKDSSTTIPVTVNGHSTELPVIHAQGTLSDQHDSEAFDYYVLDDPANPLILRGKGAGTSSAIIRIEYPVPKESPASIESSLAKNEVAEVYGIYFSFNRADIRPESERVLKEIAAILFAHPDWKLRVDGHTDGIGNAADNLDLSKRRAAAVKEALVSRYGIDAARLTNEGYGESSPRDTNDTPEGRARNRRVELRRR
jgi:outer membrane protein OmpA-like peptidoglycan-associated protein